MKITTTNNGELEIKESGVSSVIIGIILSLAGIGLAILPLFRDVEVWLSLIGLALVGMGAFFAYSARSKNIVLRNNGVSEVLETRLFTKKTSSQSFSHEQIAGVGLDSSSHLETERTGDNLRSRRVRESTLYISLTDGNQIVLGQDRRSGSGGLSMNGISLGSFGKPPLTSEAEQIAGFFGVALNQREQVGSNFGGISQTIESTGGIVNNSANPNITGAPSNVGQAQINTASTAPSITGQPQPTQTNEQFAPVDQSAVNAN